MGPPLADGIRGNHTNALLPFPQQQNGHKKLCRLNSEVLPTKLLSTCYHFIFFSANFCDPIGKQLTHVELMLSGIFVFQS